MAHPTCPHCSCAADSGDRMHTLLLLLAADDLDAAIEAGLLDAAMCDTCTPACAAHLQLAVDVRRRALAARERHRARASRLARRMSERDASRRVPAAAITASPLASTAPALPVAAADVLARALARAAAKVNARRP